MDSKEAVTKALLYSDLFSFPLTKREILRFAPERKLTMPEVERALLMLGKLGVIVEENGCYALNGRKKIIARRRRLREINAEKLAMARKTARILARIPSVQFIGLSGSLACGNAMATDDIDFFVITRKNTLFTTRFLLLVLLQLLGRRRQRKAHRTANTICLNFLIDETAMFFVSDTLYTARELSQLVPLFSRGNSYQRLLEQNRWLPKILPNMRARRIVQRGKPVRGAGLLSLVEPYFRQLELISILRHRTKEVVSANYLAFHPRDYQGKTLQRYRDALRPFEPFFRSFVASKRITADIDNPRNIFYTA